MDKFFSFFGKVMLFIIIAGVIAVPAYFYGQKSSKNSTEKSDNKVGSVSQKVPAPGYENIEEIIVEDEKTGSIKGVLGYPSDGIPPLEVFAISASDDSKFYFIKTSTNQSTFEIEDLEPGNYYVLAYTESNFAGGWTKAVPCGLTIECNDHTLLSVEVEAGETTSGIEIKDWYAPENTFPARPN